jgi:hypothetical protein
MHQSSRGVRSPDGPPLLRNIMDGIEKQEILHIGEMLDERFGERQATRS